MFLVQNLIRLMVLISCQIVVLALVEIFVCSRNTSVGKQRKKVLALVDFFIFLGCI